MLKSQLKPSTCRGEIDSLDELSPIIVPLKIQSRGATARGPEPVTVGVPLPQGCLTNVARGALRTSSSVVAGPLQFRVQTRWPDGTIRWLLADFMWPGGGPPSEHVQLELHGAAEESVEEPPAPWVRRLDQEIQVESRRVHFRVSRTRFETTFGHQPDGPDAFILGWVLVDAKGRAHTPRLRDLQIEYQGPLRTCLVSRGHFPALKLNLEVRQTFFAPIGVVKLEATLHNPRRAKHAGGLWDLGDSGSVLFRDFSFVGTRVQPSCSAVVHWTLAARSAAETCQLDERDAWTLYQDSSGGSNWQSQAHVNREGRIASRFRGYRVLRGERIEVSGWRASPSVVVEHSCGESVRIAVPDFWQQFPKSIELRPGGWRVGLFPREFDDLHELQGGEQKTHTVWLELATPRPQLPAAGLQWVHEPTIATPDMSWWNRCGAWPRLDVPDDAPIEHLDAVLAEFLDGPRSVFAHRERVDQYGWRHYGDVHADHEEAYYRGPQPLISHYNNQFDMVQGFLLQYLRTGELKFWELGTSLARHVIDIDIYHTRRDKAAYNGGLFWFTDHYKHAYTSTHRTYSRHNLPQHGRRQYGGGPNAQHNFTTGLLLYHWLTGDVLARQAVLSLADWVIGMDDGRATVLGILDEGPTGKATATGDPDYHGPGRAAGNSINALLDAWVLTQDRRYLQYAEQLIERCVHPADDISAQDLLNVEKRWSYTVFLSSLAKYLATKEEAGQRDRMYGYARASLLHYARWMLDHERPYFDHVENLEFPTEAWAGQEFRKANVLRLAAWHAEEPWRTRMLDRGDELGDRAWHDLMRFQTRCTARAVALVMIEGLLDCWLRRRDLQVVGQTPCHIPFGRPRAFVPQKQRVRRMLASPLGTVAAACRLATVGRWFARRRQTLRSGATGPA